MELKFNRIQDLSDARYASAMMARWVGFEMLGPNALPIAGIQEITGWINGPELILELNTDEEISENRLLSWMDVLPVKGIECNANFYRQFAGKEEFEGLTWLITDDKLQTLASEDKVFTHSSEKATALPQKHILKLASTSGYNRELLENYAGLSLDCEYFENPALKNYEHWNSFFEDLEWV